MAYSLFLGSGPVGQLEIFSAECKRLFDGGESLENAISEGYELAKKVSLEYGSKDHKRPFPGYRDLMLSDEENFEKFHPFEVYREYARQAVPNLSFPIIAVEGERDSYLDFSEIIREFDLSRFIVPQRMKFRGYREVGLLRKCGYNLDPSLPDVETLISQNSYPKVLAGSHFLSISMFSEFRNYDGLEAGTSIPHQAITQLMGDKTRLYFIEEGDLIFDEGLIYRNALKAENTRPNNQNGLLDFELFGGLFFQKGDYKNRSFQVDVFPRHLVQKYDRHKRDYGQVLVEARVSDKN